MRPEGRVLALATNPASAASTRFRVLQWQPALARAGLSLRLEAYFSERAAARLYRPGGTLAKAVVALAGAVRRLAVLARARREADVVLVHREAWPFGRGPGRDGLGGFAGPIVYDYDDALFLPQRAGRGLLGRLEDLDAPRRLMRRSRVVLAGNGYLAEYARGHAPRVELLPTCVDTERFRPVPRVADGLPVLGWIGSHSTRRYLEGLRPVLERVARARPFRLLVVGAGAPVAVDGVDVQARPWSLAREAADFAGCDVGLYPLAGEPWVQGKCGFKAIQFMACGVPVVAEDIGANREIVTDGINGRLATGADAWEAALVELIARADRRAELGAAGRATIAARYSVAAHAPRVAATFRELADAA